jgi:hypothetical protein
MIRDVPKQLFLAVIDGQEPSGWIPWKTRLEVLSAKFDQTPLRIQKDWDQWSEHRLKLLLHSPGVLFNRQESEWVRVIGVMVDARTRTGNAWAQLVATFTRLCKKVADTEDPWYLRLGFFVLAVQAPSDSEIGLAAKLADEAERWLNTQRRRVLLTPHDLDDEEVWEFVLTDCNMTLIRAIARETAIAV